MKGSGLEKASRRKRLERERGGRMKERKIEREKKRKREQRES
jgi:hypothetical protein